MKNPFSINKSYKIRHEILEVLYKDWEKNNKDISRRVGSIKIADETKTAISDIHRFQYLLVEKGEIIIMDNDGQSMISIQENGISAYVGQKYIKEGRKERLDEIYDWARILIPLGALILSIINYSANRTINEKIRNIEVQLNQIKK